MRAVQVVCEDPALAVECRRGAPSFSVSVCDPGKPPGSADSEDRQPPWVVAALEQIAPETALGLCLLQTPRLSTLVELSDAARSTDTYLALWVLEPQLPRDPILEAASDLGIVVAPEVAPLLITLQFLSRDLERPWLASTRQLTPMERRRWAVLAAEGSTGGKRVGHIRSSTEGTLEYAARKTDGGIPLGDAPRVIQALLAMQRTEHRAPRVTNTVDDVEASSVLEVLFGPRRALSDPASKAALSPYGLPLPVEELCTSPSRAAAEAGRIGFPVRIALASPDLRIWDHPELAADMLDSAAQVRERFRQLLATVERAHGSSLGRPVPGTPRVLGFTVMATGPAVALFRISARPLPAGRVHTELAFADPHGLAAGDATALVLPGSGALVERAVSRLAGGSLILHAPPAQRTAFLDALTDVLLRTAAFVNDRRSEVEQVELRPVLLLPDGSAEVREACIQVSDAFERSMDATLGR